MATASTIAAITNTRVRDLGAVTGMSYTSSEPAHPLPSRALQISAATRRRSGARGLLLRHLLDVADGFDR